MIEWIKRLRSTERGRTVFKLSLYLLFLFFVLVLCLAAGVMNSPRRGVTVSDGKEVPKEEEKKPVENEEETSKTYFDKQKMFEGDYDFEYDIYAAGVTINFIGGKTDDIVEGFREDGTNLIHYKIDNGTVYKVNLLDTEELTDFYDGLNESFFDFTNMFTMLNASSATIEKDGKDKIYNYTVGEVTYKVVCGEKSISRIEIVQGDDKYDLSFKF